MLSLFHARSRRGLLSEGTRSGPPHNKDKEGVPALKIEQNNRFDQINQSKNSAWTRDRQLRGSIKDAFAVGLGYIPLGMGMGMVLTGAGLPWWWAPIFAVFMYSGSMQYLVVPMIVAGESLWGIAITTVLVQFRHLFYGISFPLDLVRSRWLRAYGVHALTDEVFAIVTSRSRTELSGRRVSATQIMCHSYWVTGCTLGALVGLVIPLDERILNFVLTSLFVVLTIESYRASRRRFEIAIAALCAGVGLVLPSAIMLPVTLTMLLIVLSFWGFLRASGPLALMESPTQVKKNSKG